MTVNQEKATFSVRLKFALEERHDSVKNGTDLARLFNLQHLNGISVQTAHKWWNERAIPSDDKMATLAMWLHMPEHWLLAGLPLPKPDQDA